MSPVCCIPGPKSSATAGAARLPVPRPPLTSPPVGVEAAERIHALGEKGKLTTPRAGNVDQGRRACGRWGCGSWKVLGPRSLGLSLERCPLQALSLPPLLLQLHCPPPSAGGLDPNPLS